MTRVFVHGIPETEAVWWPLVSELRARGVDDVVLLSPPGFGAPVPSGWNATRIDYRDWLIGELERIRQVNDEVHLVGHDWGAGHVFGVVAQRPELLSSWAADCGGILHPDYVWHDGALAWQTPDVGEQSIAGMVGLSNEEMAGYWGGNGITGEVARHMATGVDADMGRCILKLYRSAVQPVLSELGDAVAAAPHRPGLVVIATADTYTGTPDMARDTATRLGATTVELEGAGHWWMVEQPAAAADALCGFWGGL